MAELNLDPAAPGKVEPKKNLLEKAGDYLKGRYKNEIGLGEDFIQEVTKPGAIKEKLSAKNIKKNLLPAIMDTFKQQAASSYGVVNSATMGAPDAIVSALSRATKSDAYKKLKEFKKEHALASDYGELGGTVASMIVPGGTGYAKAGQAAGKLGLKGAAKGLGKLANVASGATKLGKGAGLLGRIGGAVGRGVIQSAEQAIPRGILTAIRENNLGRGATEAGTGIALGGALGGGLQVVGEGLKGLVGGASKYAQSRGIIKAPGGLKGVDLPQKSPVDFITDPLEEKLLKDVVKGRLPGLNTGMLNKSLRQYARKIGVDPSGYVRTHGKAALEALVGVMDTYGTRSVDDLQDLMDGAGGLFDKAYKKAAASGVTPASILAPAMEEGGEIARFAVEHGDDANGLISRIMKNVGDAPDIRTAKNSIDRLIGNYRRNPTPGNMAETEAAGLLAALKTKIDDAVVEIDPDLAKAKKLWKDLAPIKEMLARDEIDLPTLMSGSPTAEKQAISSGIKNIISGTGNPAAIAADAIASTVGKKAASEAQGVSNFIRGEFADVLRKPENLARLKAGVEGIKKIGGGIGKIGAALPEVAPRVAGALPSILSQKAEEGPTGSTLEPADQEVQDAQASAQASEEAATPEAVQEAKDEVNTVWADRVEDNVRQAFYQYGIGDMGYSYEDFVGAVREGTNDFDPLLAAEIVFTDKAERASFLKDYDKALQYKSVDVAQALEPSSGGFMGILGPSAGTKSSRAQLTDYIARVAGEDPMLMDAKKKKKIDSTVKRIAGMKGSQAEKQSALLRELQANYGVDFARLADLGLLGVV